MVMMIYDDDDDGDDNDDDPSNKISTSKVTNENVSLSYKIVTNSILSHKIIKLSNSYTTSIEISFI